MENRYRAYKGKRHLCKSFWNSFGEESSDYDPDTKLKVPQDDLLFFRQMAVMLWVPLSQGLELLAENMTNKKFGACISISRN